MRYYQIQVLNDDNSIYAQWNSHTQQGAGIADPGAPQVEFDLPIYSFETPQGAGIVKVFGIGLKMISQASNLNGKSITVSVGMAKGLPLANPNQHGLPLHGKIFQCFGNWQGVEQSLVIIFQPQAGSQAAPANISLNWLAGQSLQTALDSALGIAFPSYTRQFLISQKLILSYDQTAIYQNLAQLSDYVNGISKKIINDQTYNGVKISFRNNVLYVFDNTTSTDPKQIAFSDLIGQPTWIDLVTIQVQLVGRGDIYVSDYITLPQAPLQTSQAANNQAKNALTFTGKYLVTKVRLVGASRQPSGNSWVAVIDALAQTK